MSSRYQINRLWNGIAPILTTNLIEAGVIEAAANESLTLAAVTAFDRYTNSSLTSTAAAQEVDSSSPTNKRRRRRRPSYQDKQSADDLLTNTESSAVSTPNDNFFEYQRRMGYTLDNNQFDDLLHKIERNTLSKQLFTTYNTLMSTMTEKIIVRAIYHNNAWLALLYTHCNLILLKLVSIYGRPYSVGKGPITNFMSMRVQSSVECTIVIVLLGVLRLF